MTAWPALRILLIGALLGTGCGTNAPEIPPELLEPTRADPLDYPPGPYGAEVSDTVENLHFEGWLDPAAAGFDSEAFEPISFADFYNPDAASGPELLLVNTTAVWCQSCRIEHADLPERDRTLGPRGLVILALMYQDGNEQPATPRDLEVWARQFETSFPMALDRDFLMGRFVPADVAPLNLLIDARSMTVLERFIGDQAAVIWPTIDDELSQRGR
jgi:hypothetical protein